MKIYVASHDRWAAAHAASVLSSAGHTITSRWHGKEFLQTSEHTVEERVAIATEDYEDVAAADALVLIAGPDRYSGGKFVETGIALGMGKHVVVIGRRENMLIWLPAIKQVDDPQGAADLLAQSDFDARIRSALVEPVVNEFGEPFIDQPRMSTPPAAAVTGLDGWQLVPKEPTEVMKVLGCEYADPLGRLISWDPSKGDCTTRDEVAGVYKAMLSAAPSPVTEEESEPCPVCGNEERGQGGYLSCECPAPSPVGDRDALIERLVKAATCALGHLTGNMDGDMDLGDPVEMLRAALSLPEHAEDRKDKK